MSELQIDFVVQATGGKILSRHQEIFSSIATDTRSPMPRALFIALKGDSFDAHRFLAQAVQQGAAALLVENENELTLKEQVTVILVPDTLKALQNLAHQVRLRNSAQVIGIAGSNGKTTSKEFTAALIGQFRQVHFSKGSFNNHWGVPFTLLAQPEHAEVAVVEMGMNHQDELALLAKIAAPDIAVCTYVGIEHIEYFGSLEKIAQAEQEIYDFSPASCTRIYNLDNSYTRQMWETAAQKFPKAKILTFSEKQDADVHLQIRSLSMTEMVIEGAIAGEKGTAVVAVFGKHNVTNLMVAAAAGLAAGLLPSQIWAGLCACKTNWGRNQLVHTKSGAVILFDGYNSNPDSMCALIENLNLLTTSARKIGIFAEMRELGALAGKLHQETGAFVAQGNLNEIYFYGPHHQDFVQGLRTKNFAGKITSSEDFSQAIAAEIAGGLKTGDVVVVKGSRGMKLERFVNLANPLDFADPGVS